MLAKNPSFRTDHTRLGKGVYLSCTNGDIQTWDIRISEPNRGEYLSTGVCHTMEHLFSTYARNGRFQDRIIHIGPMGSRTGLVLLTRSMSSGEVLSLIQESFLFMSSYEGDIPGVSVEECGNFMDHDLQGCHRVSEEFLKVLMKIDPEKMKYTEDL